ncbi:MAG: ABC transporter permease [Treponema sp.]|jgi:NitT/TauT family transport system permease protein|nr:ABC transporter permease [Treponema sp.]
MNRTTRFLVSLSIIIIFFALWEVASRFYLVNPAFVPPFSAVAANAVEMIRRGGLIVHIRASLFRACMGTAAAVILGIPLGFALSHLAGKFRLVLGHPADLLAHLSPFLLFHIVILFLGIGEAAKITIAAWACLWPVAFNTAAGVDSIDPLILKAGRAFSGNPLTLFFKVILAAASPKIFSGIRISAGYSLLMLVAAEMMGGRSGLGWLILNNQVNFQLENVFSIALVIALTGIALDAVMVFIQQRCFGSQGWEIEEYINSSGA